jgi:hypothetical protein
MPLNRILQVMPFTGMEAKSLGYIIGLSGQEDSLAIVEPPAGIHVPYIDPVRLVSATLVHEGWDNARAMGAAREAYLRIRPDLELQQRPILYTGDEEDIRFMAEMIPMRTAIDLLSPLVIGNGFVLSFLEKAEHASTVCRTFFGSDFGRATKNLLELPDSQTPRLMYMSLSCLSTQIALDISAEEPDFRIYKKWKDNIRISVARIEAMHGKQVFCYKDPNCDYDDDLCHLFLGLHYYTTACPESPLAEFMLEVTGLPSIDMLLEALLKPENYTHPWAVCDPFFNVETWPIRFDYAQIEKKPCVAIVFENEMARRRAEEIALSKIGCRYVFCAPDGILNEAWAGNASRHGELVCCLHSITNQEKFLSSINELHVIEREPSPGKGCNMAISVDNAKLLYKGYLAENVSAYLHDVYEYGVKNFEIKLQKNGIAQQVERGTGI